MTTREIIEPTNPHLNVSRNYKIPHSPGVKGNGLVFLSGMLSIDPDTGDRKFSTTANETRQILQNMSHMLESCGSSMSKVVKITVLLADMIDLKNMNKVYREFFPVDPPARTVCGVRVGSGYKLEIECIAICE
jgi:2-iminobutanoate/2-iminopropanoate deaminase